jgi:hypothetical protein
VPREPCIPDFIVTAEGEATRRARTFLVEMIAVADEACRARKKPVYDLVAKVIDAPVVRHNIHRPMDGTQRDVIAVSVGYATITGPDPGDLGVIDVILQPSS